ncbi:hypothetical protein ACE193_22340 [Bernardetia sp. OM2101]|uniref:hypothetical protein n=1 Tax=Bernardetia sp. OM2101 TaxID=3344876 RepID=UPI0035D0A856
MTTHTLQKEKHQDFLKQERIDPITGDLLQENDKIVICAACKSAFLVDSWEYMDKKHCEQSLTLKEIPKQEVVIIDKSSIYLNVNLEIKAISNKDAAKKASSFISFLGVFIYIIYALNFHDFLNYFYNLLIMLSIVWIPQFIFWTISDYKEQLNIKGNVLSFSLNDKNWNNNITLNSIKNISYYKPSRYWIYNFFRKRLKKYEQKEIYTLKFTLKDKTRHKVLITKKTLERIKNETNLLQQFDKSYLTSTSPTIKQHLA